MLKIGFATRSILPSRPAMLLGQKHTRVADKAMDPLTVTALAMESDAAPGTGAAEKSIIISGDIVLIPESIQADVQQRVAAAIPGFPADHLFLAATHTHTSLVHAGPFYPQPPGDVMTAEECAAFFTERCVEAAVAAWKARAPGKTARAYGHAVIAHNRRPNYDGGHTQMYGRAAVPEFRHIEGSEDHSLDMIFFWDAAGRIIGALINIPCPAQVDENLYVFSADYWHDIRAELRARLNPDLFVIGLCGAAGDVSPHFILDSKLEAEMRARRGLTERQVIARKVANAVDEALACTKPIEGEVPLKHAVKRPTLSPRRISKKERDEAAVLHAQAIKEGDPKLWWPTRLAQVVNDFDTQRQIPHVPAELHFVRIGDAVVATNPFELFTDYAHRIKSRSKAGQTLVVQLAAGSGGYLPTQRGVDGGSYGAIPSSCTVGPEGGQELVEITLQAIAEMFPEAGAKA
ncbi:MAG: hypothetical protein NTW19_07415 [Planctomycetota bacterium]|nr:hypothetical protein [Planctomycetota bacterium]